MFESLEVPKAKGRGGFAFSAAPIPGNEPHRIAKAAGSEPVILVETAPGTEVPPPVRLENLFVEHGVKCKIRHRDRVVHTGVFSVIHCTTGDINLRNQFFTLVIPFLAPLRRHPRPPEVAKVVDAIVELFRALARPARKSVQGLWAELYVIARSRDCPTLVKAWHTSPEERYDFAFGRQRLEVKSASGRLPRHHFSLEQLSTPEGAAVLIASICVERSGGGVSLGDLLGQIRGRLKGETTLLLHLESVVGATLGRNLIEALGDRFDLQLADDSIRFVEAGSVPRPPEPMPFEVTEVSFVSDLRRAPVVPVDELSKLGGLYEAALPALRTVG